MLKELKVDKLPSEWQSLSGTQVIEFDKMIVNDDRVRFETLSAQEPHPVSDYSKNSFGYETIKSTIYEVFAKRNVVVAPGKLLIVVMRRLRSL